MSGSRRIGRYVILREIASGGMASVHLGRADGAGGFARAVAIKRLHPHYAKDPHFAAMFLDEAKMASRVQHPNVVQTLDVVADEGELFLVMELVQGASLASLTTAPARRVHPVSPALAVAVMVAALEGLHAAHEARGTDRQPLAIVHRDVSPQNVLVGADGVVRVADFGIAKAAGRSVHTAEGQLKGKIGYMPPEQLRGEDLDRRADVYAAAVVLWELLAGRRLHDGEPTRVMYDILDRAVSAPSSENPLVPPELDTIVTKGLAKDREERFATARAMADALVATGLAASTSELAAWVAADAGDAVERARVWVEEATAVDPTPAGAAAEDAQRETRTATDVTAARDRAPVPRSRWVSLGLLAAAALAVVGGGWFAARRATKDGGAPSAPVACGGDAQACCAGGCATPTLRCDDGRCGSCVDRLVSGTNSRVTCAVMRSGRTLCWGANKPELIGAGIGDVVKQPTAIGIRNPAAMVFTQRSMLAIVDGSITGWGQSIQGVLGPKVEDGKDHLHQGDRLFDLTDVTSVALTALPTGVACGVHQGVVSCWGSNFAGSLGIPDDIALTRREPAKLPFPGDAAVASVVAGGINAVCAIMVGGGARCWGNLNPWSFSATRKADGTLDVSPYATEPREMHPRATQIVPMNEGMCLLADGIVECMGLNRACIVDEIDRGRVVTRFERRPMPASLVLPVKRLRAGMGHFCALDAADALYCWGANDRAQAGNGAPGDRSVCTPQRIDYGAPVRDFALGSQSTCVLTNDGVVRCFGNNESGAFGEPSTLEGLAWSDAKPIPISCADDAPSP